MKKRILVIASVLILIPAVLFILVCFAAGSYAKKNINTEYDEKPLVHHLPLFLQIRIMGTMSIFP